MGGECPSSATVHPEGEGINTMCKVSLTPTCGVALLPGSPLGIAFVAIYESCIPCIIDSSHRLTWLLCHKGDWLVFMAESVFHKGGTGKRNQLYQNGKT